MLKNINRTDLGENFFLGVATSSYQIEGAVNEGRRGASIWDDFCANPTNIKDRSSGAIACDHYHRYKEDVDLIKWMGVDAYRFSIAWPRVIPNGKGPVNSKGLDFYERLIDCLVEKGISPCVTLYHWDLPSALELNGGWLNRSTAFYFADYAAEVVNRLGDRVGMWMTHNEPWCQSFLGYETGLFAPGKKNLSEALLCSHHLLLSHGLAVEAIRSEVSSGIGIAPNFMPAYPYSDSESDVLAAKRQDGYFNRWFIEPVLGLGYPEDMLEWYGKSMPSIDLNDMSIISQPVDFIGVNYYERCVVKHDENSGQLKLSHVDLTQNPCTADREIYPKGLYEVLLRLHENYHVPKIIITENGAAANNDEELVVNGSVVDEVRTKYINDHLEQVILAKQDGIPVDGYFAWSLMDNFEWSEGYSLRYGLVHVDFNTQVRTPKKSAYFFKAFCET